MNNNLGTGINNLVAESGPSDYEAFMEAVKGNPYESDLALRKAGFDYPVGYQPMFNEENKQFGFYRYNDNGDVETIDNPTRIKDLPMRSIDTLRERYLPFIKEAQQGDNLNNVRKLNKIFGRWDNEKALQKFFAKNFGK